MIFNMSGSAAAGSGSGAGLNFRVVGGTSEPLNPIENTIWVNTDSPITEWTFSYENPYLRYENGNVLDNITILNRCLYDGESLAQDSYYREVHTEEYIPVEYGVQYSYNYKFSNNNSMWLAIAEYDRNHTYIKSSYPISNVTSSYKEGFYTPSSESIAFVRLSWRTYNDAGCKVEFFSNVSVPTLENNGKVWIKIGTSSPDAFNVLKNNGIMVYPLSVEQCINGEFVDKTAKSYQNGEWVNWFGGYYFKYGIGVTVPWATLASSTSSVDITDESINFNCPQGGYALAYTEEAVNLKQFNTLYIEHVSGCNIGVASSINSYSSVTWIAYKENDNISNRVVHSVDISDIDSGYIVVQSQYSSTIYNVWVK